MKILVTGFGTRHVNSDRQRLPIATGITALVRLLEEGGHEVDWRAVTPGEPLVGKYERALVVVIPPTSLTARYCLGGLWALSELGLGACDVVIDDWQTKQIVSGAKTQAREPARMWKELLNRVGREECLASPALKATLESVIRVMAGDAWPWRVWAPMFRYGNPYALSLPATSYVQYDPSMFFWRQKDRPEILRGYLGSELRTRQWVSASLLSKQDWLDKTRVTWPVSKLGNVKQGQPRLEEDAVLRAYGASWGVLSCPHDHAGSGWWRARYPFAALMGAVLFGSYKETKDLGESYRHFGAKEVEDLSTEELSVLAQRQCADFLKLAVPYDELKELVCVGAWA